MKDRIANCLCVLAAFAAALFVGIAVTNNPVVARQKTEVPPGCVWEWTAFGWINVSDKCFGFCNYPDNDGLFIGDLASTPCVGR